MVIRNPGRKAALIAIVACAPLINGCATTERYIVNPDLAASARVETIWTATTPLHFDADGGVIDPVAKTVTGRDRSGGPQEVPLVEVRRFQFRQNSRGPIAGNPAPLIDGPDWRPGGRIEQIALRNGQIVDVRETPTMVDSQQKSVLGTPANGPPFAYAFGEILYVQIRGPHHGRSAVAVTAAFLATGVIIAVIAAQNYGPFLGPY